MNRLEEIKNRLAAATPGPWHRPLNTRYKSTVTAELPEGETGRYRDGVDPITDERERITVASIPIWSDGKHLRKRGGRDLEFIAHAPEDIAYLLAEVERQRSRAKFFEDAAAHVTRELNAFHDAHEQCSEADS